MFSTQERRYQMSMSRVPRTGRRRRVSLRALCEGEGGYHIKRIMGILLALVIAFICMTMWKVSITNVPEPVPRPSSATVSMPTVPTITEETESTTPTINKFDVEYELYHEMRMRYRRENIELLAKVITVEMGADWVSDLAQQLVGSVVLNRLEHERFPDTLREVIYQRGQYPSAHNGVLDNCEPTGQALRNAEWLWDNGSVLPENVVFQAEFIQGTSIYIVYHDPVIKTTTYFCTL